MSVDEINAALQVVMYQFIEISALNLQSIKEMLS